VAERKGVGSHKSVKSAIKKRVTHVKAKRAAANAHKTRTVNIKPHHTKSYRKRHYGGLAIFLIVSTILFTWLYIYRSQVNNSVNSAEDFISTTFNSAPATQQTVNSTYGFSFKYDARNFYASAIDSASGDLFLGQELTTNRPYSTVRVSTGSVDIKSSQRSLTISYYNDKEVSSIGDVQLKNLENAAALNGIDTTKTTVTSTTSTKVTFDSVTFNLTEWQQVSKDGVLAGKLPVSFRTYSGVVEGRAMVIKVAYGLTTGSAREVFKDILNSMKFGNRTQAFIPTNTVVAQKIATNRSLLDTLLFTELASAAVPTANVSEKISSRYSPAVVKIYNVYCMDVTIDGKAYLHNACSAASGSGFFVNGNNGLVATNGHVASADPIDTVINDAVQTLVSGDPTYFNEMMTFAGIKQSDIADKKSDADIVDYAVDRMYAIDPSRIVAVNNVTNLLVDLGEKQPNIDELLKDTENRQVYAEQDTIKKATLIKKNYREIDGVTSFKASDVALIKINGNNYPVTKIGSIDGLTQGADIMILGYPGQASNNGLVDSTASKPTLTAGKVSSIKNATGSTKKLIETDTTIGHGNSGGPAFDTNGNVIGIATYSIDGAGTGNGTYNYVRDIKDLVDLVASAGQNIDPKSTTQDEWNKGIDLFYKAHYSAAVKSFNKVKQLYPADPTADSLIAAANERIKAGQDIKDFPYVILIAAIASVLGIAVMIIFIIRHRKAHVVYAGQVASGAMQPMMPGMAPQQVIYSGMPQQPMAAPQQMPLQQSVPMQMPQQQPMTVPQPTFAPAPQQPVAPSQPVMVQPNPAQPMAQQIPQVITPTNINQSPRI
jgi:S1-C subfamily serine protease